MDQRLFLIHEGDTGNALERVEALQSAAEHCDVETRVLDSVAVDYSNLPRPVRGDMLYNCCRGSARLESLLLRPDLATFYSSVPALVLSVNDTTIFGVTHERAGLRAPRTIHQLTRDPVRLGNYAAALGGFPLILKVVGGTGGTGTIVVESFRSLRSLADYFVASGLEFILREFIPPRAVGRLTVLGDRVVSSVKKFIPEGDFRSDGYFRPCEAADFGEDAAALALRATRVAGWEFAGVDILISESGAPYLLEANFPCNFVPPEKETGVPLSRYMVEYLLEKSRRIRAGA